STKSLIFCLSFSYPSCSGTLAPGLAADMHFISDVIAFIGPACLFALEPVARLAAYWNTPIITGMGDQPPSEGELSVASRILGRYTPNNKNDSAGILKDKSKYPTLTRMSYCQCRLKIVFSSIFKQFGWKHIALILDRSDLFSLTVVVILSVRGSLVRKFMLSAHVLGMTKGDWTFLDVEIFPGSYWGDHDWKAGDSEDSVARKAYEALLRVSLLQPTSDKFQDFADKVKQRSLDYYNYTISEGEEVNFVIGAFYDGVYLLGMALNETLWEGGDIRDGLNITTRMWNRDFLGITGHVRIDDNGDRDADYSILDLDPITGKFEVVGHYNGLHKLYSPVPGKKIHWPGGREGPPPDVPKCGFMDNSPDCRNHEAYMMIIYGSFAFGVFLAFTTTLICVTYKHLKTAADLNNMSWRIRPEEVHLEKRQVFWITISTAKTFRGSQREGPPYAAGVDKHRNENHQFIKPSYILLCLGGSACSSGTRGSQAEKSCGGETTYGLTSCRTSVTSCNSLQATKIFTTVGIYRGSRVAIKKIIRKKVDINKKLLWEIKQGMSYLHSCEVSVHGKLRSCNCLIDGRFVLKISDFGLTSLTTPLEVIKDNKYYRKMLWVAPELLPLTVIPGTPATQKGDVFSFGIILEEIIVRGGPYEAARQFLEAHEIIARVASREKSTFSSSSELERLSRRELVELMEKCWNDNPEDRPPFENIRLGLRNIMK
ncbi:hypothetical protein NQ314_012015, partial [Rhamnusium bicolor]